MNPRDKMPLEVTPIFHKLQRYDASKLAPAAAPPAPTPRESAPQATAPQAGDQPASEGATPPPPAATAPSPQ
jgi:hypothetical protein